MARPAHRRFRPSIACECGDHFFVDTNRWGIVLVSPQDATLLDNHNWVLQESSSQVAYAKAYTLKSERKQATCLHQEIAKIILEIGLLADHLNHNGLDNRRGNLRGSTNQENIWHSRLSRENKSGFKGVYFEDFLSSRPWRAAIQVDGRIKNLGRYSTARLAARAYDVAAQEYFGQFAWLNFPATNGE